MESAECYYPDYQYIVAVIEFVFDDVIVGSRDENLTGYEYALFAFDYKKDEVYVVPFDQTDTRMESIWDISPDWLNTFFEWQKTDDGLFKLKKRELDQLPPWQGKLWHDSISLFSDVIEKGENDQGKYNPFMSMAFNNRGIAKKKMGDFNSALVDYNKAMEINPGDYKSYLNRGNIFFETRDLQQALSNYNKSIELKEDNPKAYSSRSAVYGMQKNYAASLEDINRSLQLDPSAPDAYKNRSTIYYETGKFAEALADANSYLGMRNSDHTMVNLRGLAQMELGNYSAAAQDFGKAIMLSPQQGVYYYNRSRLNQRTGNKNAALNDALNAQKLGTAVPQDYINGLR